MVQALHQPPLTQRRVRAVPGRAPARPSPKLAAIDDLALVIAPVATPAPVASALAPAAPVALRSVPVRSPAPRALPTVQPEPRDLTAVAHVAYHYLLNGRLDFAQTLYRGLLAWAPRDAYYALALGLTHDLLGEHEEAARHYSQAARLDPEDGRAEVNLAELRLLRRDLAGARAHLLRGVQKAERKGDEALALKARAILNHLDQKLARRPA